MTIVPLPIQLSADVVHRHLRAARRWELDADVPDPLLGKDLIFAPALTAQVLAARIAEDRLVGHPHCFRVSKPGGGQRPFTYMDPLAHLLFRIIATQAVGAASRNLSASVVHVRPERTTDGCWRADDWRAARKVRADRAREVTQALKQRGGGFVATLDVANHFPTVSLDRLAFLLQSFAVSPQSVDCVNRFLTRLHGFSRIPSGLPIGAEASAILGTAYLIPIDRVIERSGIASAVRWMDDLSIADQSEGNIHATIAAIASALDLGQQALNDAKTKVEHIGHASHPDMSGTNDEDDVVTRVEHSDNASELELRCANQDSERVAYILGGLRAKKNPAALPIMERYPWLTRTFAKQCGQYAGSVVDAISDRDREWIAERVLVPTTADNVFEQTRLAYVLRDARCLARHGTLLFERSNSVDRSQHAVLADALACAAGSSREKSAVRTSRAVDQAMELADFNARRAHFSSLRNDQLGKQAEFALAEILRKDSDMAATVNWLRGAAR